MENKDIAKQYLVWAGENYEAQKRKFQSYCFNKHILFSEDILHHTIIKVHDKIEKTGMKDPTPKGFDDYLFLAFKNNIIREKQYARNTHRDHNVTNLTKAYEQYVNEFQMSANDKIMQDLRKDFTSLYLLRKVEEQFGNDLLHLFQLKYFSKMSYKDIKETTDIPHSRQRILEIKQWLKDNVTKRDVDNAFQEFLTNNQL